jgi:hypothetical protein
VAAPRDLVGEPADGVEIIARAFLSGERLAGEFQQNARIFEIGHAAAHASPNWYRTNRRTWMFSPVFAETSFTRSPNGLSSARGTHAW